MRIAVAGCGLSPGENAQLLCLICVILRGVAQPGSALRSGRSGRRFKSSHPDHYFQIGKISLDVATSIIGLRRV